MSALCSTVYLGDLPSVYWGESILARTKVRWRSETGRTLNRFYYVESTRKVQQYQTEILASVGLNEKIGKYKKNLDKEIF
jgi:hypothetical protein